MQPTEHNEEMAYEDWLDSTGYPEWRKQELRDVYKKMEEDDSFFMNEVDRLHKNADVKIFMKEENYPEYKLPRAIWARVDEFKNISGPFFKTIEKKIFSLPYFIKKIPKHERPQYIIDQVKQDGMIYMCTDYTSFESLFTTDMQDDCEFALYRYMSSKNSKMKRICRMLFNVLAGDNICGNKYFKAAIDAKRMSGEMNTSLGNGFSNLMFTLFAFDYYKIGTSGTVVEGDDGLSGVSRAIPDEYFVKMGLNVKMEIKNDVTESSFCGIISDTDEKINITEPLQYLVFGFWVSRKYAFSSDRVFYGLVKSKALSMAYEYPGCPILDAFSKRILELLVDVEFYDERTDHYTLQMRKQARQALESGNFPSRSTGPRTRELMERYFKIPVEIQLTIENKIRKMTFDHWDHSDILPLIPEQWIQNYDRYVYNWNKQTQWAIKHPPLPIGENEIIYKLARTNLGQLRHMDKILSKREYFALNRGNFKVLTERQKNEKYAEYLLKRKDKKKRLVKNNRPLAVGGNTRPRRNGPPKLTKMGISECTLLYARASIDPFSSLEKDPCIPDSISAPSYKFNVTLMGSMTVGTAGVGYALLQPWTAAINNNSSNAASIDQPLIVTSATYNASNILINPVDIGTNILGINSNSYFTDPGFTAAQIRIVAAGIEAFYTGTVLNQAGVVTTLQYDGGQAVPGGISTAEIMSNPKSAVCSTSKDARCYISYYPTNSSQFSYSNFDNGRPSNQGLTHNGSMIILVTGAVPGTTFQIKGRVYYEAQIPGMSSTESEADPIGFAALQSARTKQTQTNDPSQDLRLVLQETLKNLAHNISGIAPTAGRAIGTIFGQPEIGGLMGDAASMALNSLLK